MIVDRSKDQISNSVVSISFNILGLTTLVLEPQFSKGNIPVPACRYSYLATNLVATAILLGFCPDLKTNSDGSSFLSEVSQNIYLRTNLCIVMNINKKNDLLC